jgi:hypothetical protein
MRYHVRNRDGQELTFPNLADLHTLYQRGFIAEDDLVRAESSDRWVPAGSMPALRGVREQRRDPARVRMILIASMLIALLFVLLAKVAI